jgi:hypothetical protein
MLWQVRAESKNALRNVHTRIARERAHPLSTDRGQGRNLRLSSGVGSRQESRLPQIRYRVAATSR